MEDGGEESTGRRGGGERTLKRSMEGRGRGKRREGRGQVSLLGYLCCFFVLVYCCAEAFPKV